jgi:hypothetical protein
VREDEMICQKLRHSTRGDGGMELTPDEYVHLEACENCMDLVLNKALEGKPYATVPGDFAARVMASVPQDRAAYWQPRFPGLTIALVLATALLTFTGTFAAVHPPHFAPIWFGSMLVAATALEAGGLALWLTREFCT